MLQLKIREMPAQERPREKLLARGVSALSDPELIAILLRTGLRGANAVEVGRQLLEKYKSLTGISRCSVKELRKIPGIGQTKALELVAAFGLGERLARETLSKQKLDSPELVSELVGPEMRRLRTESLRVILLDTRYRLVHIEEVSVGSLNESIAHPREIFRPALTYSPHLGIAVLIHPSAAPPQAQPDHTLPRRLAEPAEFRQSKFLVHLITAPPA